MTWSEGPSYPSGTCMVLNKLAIGRIVVKSVFKGIVVGANAREIYDI